MTSVVEVELPRYTIAPLERSSELYWKLDDTGIDASHGFNHAMALMRAESTLSMIEEGRVSGFLRGGSWRTFHWKKLVVGRKLYRIQYEDELREPPAEIDFSDLVQFLLDWGAVPDENGWDKLKHGGLWTPGGTVLLNRAEGLDSESDDFKTRRAGDWVLRTSVPDESDGVLSINVRWNSWEGMVATGRGAGSLPPGWGRLNQPRRIDVNEEVEKKGLAGRIEELRLNIKVAQKTESVRFRVENNMVTEVLWEHSNIETGNKTDLLVTDQTNSALWFTCAASALQHRKEGCGGLWGFELPADIANFARRDSIPCGILVLLGIIPEMDAPHWTSAETHSSSDASLLHNRRHQRFLETQRAIQLERTMPEVQARTHRSNREAAERQAMMDDMMGDIRERERKEEQRVKDAISSLKMSSKAVAEACLAWLIKKEEVGEDCTLEGLAEAVLYMMVVDQRENGETAKMVEVLEEWMSWAHNGSMKKIQLAFLQERKVEFCFATALMSIIHEAAGASAKAGADMIECLKLWRKVRLG
jgi:hypothetical protein